jgi:hypothetical protein
VNPNGVRCGGRTPYNFKIVFPEPRSIRPIRFARKIDIAR